MTDPERALIDKARRYIRSADMLRAAGDYDSTASRLYYAMFYCAEAALLRKGLSFSSHRGVIAGFGLHLVKSGEVPQQMHLWLIQAFDKRQLADHVPLPSVNEKDVEDLQAKASEFLARIETLLQARGQD